MSKMTFDQPAAARMRLLLLRHAKSAWPPDLPDRERPLASRGLKAAPLMGEYMARENLIPDLALVSDARRARETWDLVGGRLGREMDVRVVPKLYDASPADMLEVLVKSATKGHTLLLVGHNPGLQQLALILAKHGDPLARAAMTQKYPTAALAVIDFRMPDWRSIESCAGRLERFVTPRSLE